jgi:hypothetical protein
MVINETRAAEMLGLAVGTLRNWRCREKGPSFLKMGGAVRYDTVEIERFKLGAQRVPSSSRAAGEILRQRK